MEDEEKGEAKHVEETISEIKRGNEFSKEKVRPSLGDGIFYFSWVACPTGILMTPQFIYTFLFQISEIYTYSCFHWKYRPFTTFSIFHKSNKVFRNLCTVS